MLRQDVERFQVDRGLGEPHTFRWAAEVALEIADTPRYLGTLVPAVRQGQNHVRVCLRDRRTMSAEMLTALFVAVQDVSIGLRGRGLHPREQCRAEVEADALVIIGDLTDTAVRNRGCARRRSARSILL